MLRTELYLRGAYGPGNIGDDALMLSVLKVLKTRFSPSDIAVGVADPEMARALDSSVKWVHLKSPVVANCVVLGGGGQFFSFHRPRHHRTLMQRAAHMLTRLRAQPSIQDILGRGIIRARGGAEGIYLANHLAGFCLGFGPFNGNDDGAARAAAFLKRASYVSVRDNTSQNYCREMFGYESASVFTDPTLLPSLWCDVEPSKRPMLDADGPISMVIRDWPLDESGKRVVAAQFEAARSLLLKGRRVRLVSLYRQRDLHLINANPEFDWTCWMPTQHSICEFVENLVTSSSVIVSSRAHGMLLPAAFGVPTVGVQIENKIAEVHRMLPASTVLVDRPTPQAIEASIEDFLCRKSELTHGAQESQIFLAARVERAICEFVSWLDREVVGDQGNI